MIRINVRNIHNQENMSEEQHYEDVDISDIIDDSEPYLEDPVDIQDTEITDVPVNTLHLEPIHSEDQTSEKKQHKSEVVRTTRLPIARIKNIMKMDPDVSVIAGDAVFLVTKATELFLQTIAKETYSYTASNKRKVISKKDLDLIISKVDCLCFLEGAMDF